LRGGVFLSIAAMLFAGTMAARDAGAACAPVRGAAQPDAAEMHEAEALYLPTPQPVVEAMLHLAGVSRTDVVYDLGSGDGRIPIAAARQHGARGVGIEFDARMIERARCHAREAGMESRVEFRQEDLFQSDLREATVVTLFLFPHMVQQLGPKLFAELRPGTRIVSHRFGFGERPPDRAIEVDGHPVLLWNVR